MPEKFPAIPKKILIALASAAATAVVQAQTLGVAPVHLNNVAQLSADGSVEVVQDMLRITLSTTKQGNNAQDVQGQLKQAVDSALKVAKAEARSGLLDVHTGQFSLYPNHANNSNRIAGWQGTAQVVLTGRDVARISAVAGKISTLTVSDMSFDISPELRQKTEAEAQAKAIAAFRQKAAEITKLFGFNTYALREVSVQAEGGGGFAPRMAMAKAYGADAAPVPVEPGKTTVRVVVNGSVQMQ
ncbi:MAG: SIMPL domain-containing protein [Brachymonas sp.]|nr:SIMPL domain-containing protein [Brachymonas sp.]